MQPEHRIDELIVDLSFTTTRLARHEKALLSDWLSEDLLPALDQLFSRYSPGQQVLRFETLEFDFGNLTSRNYQQTIREQLLQKFSQLLRTQLIAVVPAHRHLPGHANSSDDPNARVALTQLFNYLISGQLSAHLPFEQPSKNTGRNVTGTSNVNRSNFKDSAVKDNITEDSITANSTNKNAIVNDLHSDARQVKKISKPIGRPAALHEQLLDVVIAQHNIAELLRELPQRELLIQRLLKQFLVPQRLELLRQLAPQQVQNVIALLDLLQLVESNSINADTHQWDSSLVWQALLQLGLEYPQASVEFWLRHVFRIVAANAGIDETRLRQKLTAINIPTGAAAVPLIALQTQIAQLSVTQNASTNQSLFADSYTGEPNSQYGAVQHNSQQSASKQPTLEQFNPEQLRQLVAAAFIRADASQLQQLWPQLITYEPQLLLVALEHYLSQAEIRQQLMLRLPLGLLSDIIALLAPALKEVFLQLQTRVGQLIELLRVQTTISPEIESVSATSNAGLSEQSSELLLRQLWEIALGLILKNQSALANADYSRDSDLFVINLAARYANLRNLDTKIVQQAFQSLINQPLSNQTQVTQPQINQSTRTNSIDSHEHFIELHGNVAAPNNQQSIKPEVPSNFVAASASPNEPVTTSDVNHQQQHADQISNSSTSSLSSVSDHQLFDLCLRLKSGALAWQSLANNIPLLRRLISSYIRLGHSATAENCADFVAAIDTQAESSSVPSAFYRAVLQSLIADKLIDLEAIALDVKSGIQFSSSVSRPEIEAKQEIKTIENLSIIKDQTAQASVGYDVESSVSGASTIADVITPLSLDALAEQLQQGKRKAESLNLTGDQFAHLVDIFIAKEKTIAFDIQVDLIAAIHQQALQANNKTDYYRRILSILARKKIPDLVQLCEQVNQQDISLPTHTHPTLAQPTGAEVTASNNIEAIVRTLLAESAPEQWLQSLQLDLAQWQAVVAELIRQTQSNDKDSGVELIDAIKYQSRQVVNPANYYRRIITAVLTHEPIDLETFAQATNSSTETVSGQLPSNPHNNFQRVNSPITAAKDIKVIVQTLLKEPQSWVRLQQLQLDDRQWETLATEIIQQSQFTDKHSAAELIEAIQNQARSAITPAVYYRLVIQAALQQQPIDLEAFAATAIDVKQLSPLHDEYKNITTDADSEITSDNSTYQNTNQSDAGQFAIEELNAEQFNTASFNTGPIDISRIDTSQINTTQFSSGNVSQNNINPNHINPDQVTPEQVMDYPLLTGSDNSLRKPALSLAQLLAAELPLTQEQLLALQQHINTLLNRSSQPMITEWCELLAVVQHAQVLIHSVPAHLLHQIAMRLQASRYPWLDALVKLVMEALALLVADINNLAIKQAKWKFIFTYLFSPDSTNTSAAETNARALELSIELCKQLANVAAIDDVQRLVNLTQRRIALLKPPAQQKPAMRLQDITTNPATQSDASTPQWEAGLHINNAGQVLAAAFLPRLFSMLNLMQDGKFIHLEAADRAVHLVQFMVTGQSETPEYELVLNKILCGIGTSIPVSAGIEITEQEQTLIEQMLNSMIQHWKVLGSTSITGLRETFFQRQGWLVLEEDCWRLKVKEQTFDLLLDRLPWSISLIKHGWMDKPLRVSWRNHS